MKNLDINELKEKLVGQNIIAKGDYEFSPAGPIIDVIKNEFEDIEVIVNDPNDGNKSIELEILVLTVPYANIWSCKYYAGDFNESNASFEERVVLDSRFDEETAKKAIVALLNTNTYFSIWDLKIEKTLYTDIKPNWEEFE